MTPFPVDSYDAAIVLGAMVRPDGSPSPALARRVGHAVRLAHAGVVSHLLMTGGAVRHPVPEARIMRDLAVAAGNALHAPLAPSAAALLRAALQRRLVHDSALVREHVQWALDSEAGQEAV